MPVAVLGLGGTDPARITLLGPLFPTPHRIERSNLRLEVIFTLRCKRRARGPVQGLWCRQTAASRLDTTSSAVGPLLLYEMH